MAENRSVQFQGVKNAVNAYKNMGLAPWAVVCGNDLLEAYEGDSLTEGAELLVTYLNALAANKSNGFYSLRVYDPMGKNARIRIKTEPARSFRFTLSEERNIVHSETREILERLERIEMRQAVETDDKDPAEKDNSIGAILSGFMEDPNVKQALGVGIAKIIEMITKPFLDMNQTGQNYLQAPATMGAVSSPEDQLKKIQAAVEILWKVDPELGDHLTQIAMIAQSNPGKYQSLISMLKLL